MECPHCTVHFHANWVDNPFARPNIVAARIDGISAHWRYRSAVCPTCGDVTIEIARFRRGEQSSVIPFEAWRQVYPVGASRGPVPPEVPPNIADDYIEACNVLPISAKPPPRSRAAAFKTCFMPTATRQRTSRRKSTFYLARRTPRRRFRTSFAQRSMVSATLAISPLTRSTTRRRFK
jgi:hypothetical protein